MLNIVCTLSGGPTLPILKVSLLSDHSKYAFWTESDFGAWLFILGICFGVKHYYSASSIIRHSPKYEHFMYEHEKGTWLILGTAVASIAGVHTLHFPAPLLSIILFGGCVLSKIASFCLHRPSEERVSKWAGQTCKQVDGKGPSSCSSHQSFG